MKVKELTKTKTGYRHSVAVVFYGCFLSSTINERSPGASPVVHLNHTNNPVSFSVNLPFNSLWVFTEATY